MTIYFNSIRGLKSKENNFKIIIEEKKPTIFCLVESWLDKKEKMKVEGYKIYRNDRNDLGGGIMVGVQKEMEHITQELTRETGQVETMWISISNNRENIKLGVVYIPKENIKKEEIKKVYKHIEEEIEEGKRNDFKVMIIGDFNAKVGNKIIPGNTEEITTGGKLLTELVEKEMMIIMNGTGICKGLWTRQQAGKKSIIDYVITESDSEGVVKQIEIDEKREWTPNRIKKKKNGKTRQVYTDHNAMLNTYNARLDRTKKEAARKTRADLHKRLLQNARRETKQDESK